MLAIINNIWISGSLPDDLKYSLMVSIIKPGKDSLHPNSHRPISLTSCFSSHGMNGKFKINSLSRKIENSTQYTT